MESMLSMGSPNPQRFEYKCPTCGVKIAPYETYCEQHREVGETYEKPLLIDRIMHRILGTGRRRAKSK